MGVIAGILFTDLALDFVAVCVIYTLYRIVKWLIERSKEDKKDE